MQEEPEQNPPSEQPIRVRLWPHLIWVLALGVLTYLLLADSFRSRTRERLLDASAISTSLITENIYNTARILVMLRKDPSVQRSLSTGTSPGLNGLQSRMVEFARNYPEIFQIRWIDDKGKERIRIDQEDGAIRIVPLPELQDKSNRYYFQEATQIERNSVYVSPLDLNIEHGVIQLPYHPVLRIAVRMFDNSNRDRGILIINVDARPVLERLKDYRSRAALELHFLNPDGYWLLGPEESRTWGQDLHQPENSFVHDYPRVWETIQTKESGEYIDEDGLWLFSHYHPETIPLKGIGKIDVPRWAIVLRTPALVFLGLHWPSLWKALATMAVLGALVYLLERRQLAQRRLRAEAERREKITHEELLKSERLSSLGRMVAGLAHEMNTPIGAARLTATTIRDHCKGVDCTVLDGESIQQNIEYVLEGNQMILDCLDQASQLVSTFKRLSVDRETVQAREFNLLEMADNILRILQPRIRRTGHRIQVSIPAEIKITSYPGPLGQILQNLIVNALDHAFEMPGGTVAVRASRSDGQIHIDVEDNGVGIPPEFVHRVFEPFFTTTRGQGGTGLGLSISKELIEGVLGGEISVVSQAGKGTRFLIEFPERAPEVQSPFWPLSKSPAEVDQSQSLLMADSTNAEDSPGTRTKE